MCVHICICTYDSKRTILRESSTRTGASQYFWQLWICINGLWKVCSRNDYMLLLGTPSILVVMQVERLAEHIGKLCCAYLVAQRAREIAFPSNTSPSGRRKAIAADVMGQTAMDLGDGDVMMHPRYKTTPKTQGAAFARILSGTLFPNKHPLMRPAQYDPACFQPGRIWMQIWLNHQIEGNFG